MSKEEGKTEEVAVEKAAPRFVGGRPRSTVVKLEYPIEFDGKVYEQITITRMTVKQLGAYIESIRNASGDPPPPPIFDAPREVIEALDADDSAAIDRIALDFLPRVLREATAPLPQDGGAM
jgi:hypothetical protein